MLRIIELTACLGYVSTVADHHHELTGLVSQKSMGVIAPQPRDPRYFLLWVPGSGQGDRDSVKGHKQCSVHERLSQEYSKWCLLRSCTRQGHDLLNNGSLNLGEEMRRIINCLQSYLSKPRVTSRMS